MTPELLAGDRQEHETSKAILACNDYLRMGPGRTLPDLLKKYAKSAQESPPTQSAGTLKKWSRSFDWQVRAAFYDSTWEQRKNAERDRVFNEELALDFERVRRLNKLARFLEEQIYFQVEETLLDAPPDSEADPVTAEHNPYVWLRDVKQIGSGDTAEKVEIVRFNSALLSEFRATLDDIARETGGRIKKSDLTSGGEKINVILSYADD